jgi:hypothetical protein
MRVYQFRHVGITKDRDYSGKLLEVNSPAKPDPAGAGL